MTKRGATLCIENSPSSSWSLSPLRWTLRRQPHQMKKTKVIAPSQRSSLCAGPESHHVSVLHADEELSVRDGQAIEDRDPGKLGL
jgi:hypothetical protein